MGIDDYIEEDRKHNEEMRPSRVRDKRAELVEDLDIIKRGLDQALYSDDVIAEYFQKLQDKNVSVTEKHIISSAILAIQEKRLNDYLDDLAEDQVENLETDEF